MLKNSIHQKTSEEWRYSGPLSECLKQFPEAEHQQHEQRWYRVQMRSWARLWRHRGCTAALLGKPVQEIGDTELNLAKMYRDYSLCAPRAAKPVCRQ